MLVMITRGAAIVTLLVVLWGPAVLGEHLVAVHYEQEHKEQARRAVEDKGYQIVHEWPELQAWYVRLPPQQHTALRAATRAASASVKAAQAIRARAAVRPHPAAAHHAVLVGPEPEPAAPTTSTTHTAARSPSPAKPGRRSLLGDTVPADNSTSDDDDATVEDADDHMAVKDAAFKHLELASAVDAAAALFVAAAQEDLADVPGISQVEGDPLMVLFAGRVSAAVHGATAAAARPAASPSLSQAPRSPSPTTGSFKAAVPAAATPAAAAAKATAVRRSAARKPAPPVAAAKTPAARTPATAAAAGVSSNLLLSNSSSKGVFSVCEPPAGVWQDALHPSGGQIIPWGIQAVQALEPNALAAAAKAPAKVMYCVLDGGLDLSAVGRDMPLGSVSGCIPSPDAAAGTLCDFPWNASTGITHGMHVLGTLSALANNGVGVQGVASQGATVKLVNVLGANETLPTNRAVRGLTWCEQQLEAAHKQHPGMKMVVSMSFGASTDTLLLQGILDRLAARGDVLLVAAAGNTGDATKQYPAAHPGVISVAALTRTLEAAAFSAYNPKVELAAPGGSIAPLLPFRPDTGISLQPYQTGTLPGLRSMSVVHSRSGRLVGSLSFTRAALGAGVSYPNTTLTAPLVDCGFGNGTSPCPNAAGAVCLIQRGNNTFCAKSLHCAVGGGLGVLFYNRDTPDVGPCDIAAPVYTLQTKCSQLGSGIIPSLSIGRQEGEALKAAMQGQQLLVTMDFRDPTLGVPVGYTSGTSMATPHVSGVAGVVWAAAPRNCSAAGLRSVLQQTALDLGVPGRDNDTGYGLVQAAAAVQAVERHGCGHGQQQAAGSSSKPGAGATGSGSKRPPPSPPKQPSLSGQTAAAGAGAAGPAGPSPPKQQQGPAGQPNGGAATPALPGSSYIPLPRSMSARSL